MKGLVHRVQRGTEGARGGAEGLVAVNRLKLAGQIGETVQGAVLACDGGLFELFASGDAGRVGIADRAGIESIEDRFHRLTEGVDGVRHIRPEQISQAVHRAEEIVGGVEVLDRLIAPECALQIAQCLHEDPDRAHGLAQLAANRPEYIGDLIGAGGEGVEVAGVAVDCRRRLAQGSSDLAGLKRQPRLLE